MSELGRGVSHLALGEIVEKNPTAAQSRYDILRKVLDDALAREKRIDGSASIRTENYQNVLIKPGMDASTIDVYAMYDRQRVRFSVDAQAGRTTLGGIPDSEVVDNIISDIVKNANSTPKSTHDIQSIRWPIGAVDSPLNTSGPKRVEETEPTVSIFPDAQASNVSPQILGSILVDRINADIRRLTFEDDGHRWLNTSRDIIEQAKNVSLNSELSVSEVIERDRVEISARQFEGQIRMASNNLDPATKLTIERLNTHDPQKLTGIFDSILTPNNFPEPTGLSIALTTIAGLMHSLKMDQELCQAVLPLGDNSPQWVSRFRSQPNFGTVDMDRTSGLVAAQGSLFTAMGVASLALTTPVGGLVGVGEGSATYLGAIAVGCIGVGAIQFMRAGSARTQAQNQALAISPMDGACLAVKRVFEE